ncbi:MAG: phage recombination protein Bet [Pseudomonadota bacterium]
MNAIVEQKTTALAPQTEQELIEVLQSSLYPGAALPSIKLALGYCKAAGLDPMQKPVHIVPMKVSTGEKDNNGWDIKADRDVIMPGIGLYRVQAARTGLYVGMTDPEFGPLKTLKYQIDTWEGNGRDRRKTTADAEIEYPEWCRVTVMRLVDGVPREFSAREYWLENYATKSASSNAPNAMWAKRVYGQIAKCAEAQALRKGFPEAIGSQPTADEMEGKNFEDGHGEPRPKDMGMVDVVQTDTVTKKADPYPQADFDKNLTTWRKVIKKGKTPDEVIATVNSLGAPLSDDQCARIRAIPEELLKEAGTRTGERTGPSTDAPAATYDQVKEKLNSAANIDVLNEAATLIAAVVGPELQAELNALFDTRAEALNA